MIRSARIAFFVGAVAFGLHARAAETGFYAGASFGPTDAVAGPSDGFLVSFVEFPGLIFRVRPETTRVDEPSVAWEALLGYRINRYLAAELAYTDFGSTHIVERFVIPPVFSGEGTVTDRATRARVQGPSLNLLGILPVAEGIEPFVRAGLLFADEETTSGPFRLSETNAEQLWIIGGGVDFAIAHRWKARFAYESVDTLGKTLSTGPLRLSRFVFGISFDF